MDKKTKALAILITLAITISVGYTFYKTIIQKDFEILEVEEEELVNVEEENIGENPLESAEISEEGDSNEFLDSQV